MTLQRRLLHAMLGLLALAALAGISTIFMTERDLIGRVAGTLFFAAVSIALAIPSSKKLGRQDERTAGLITLLAIVIGFCLSLSAVWEETLFSNTSWDLALTTLAYICTVIPALAFLSLYSRPSGKASGTTGIGFSVAVFISWIMAIWGGKFGLGKPEHWGETAGLLSIAGLPMCACFFGKLQDGRHWRFLGVLAAAAGILMGLVGIWFELGGKPTMIAHCLIIATVIGGSNVLVRLPMPRTQAWLPLVTTGMLVVTGALGMIVNYQVGDGGMRNFDDFTMRLLTAGAIVTCCGVLAIAVLMAFNRRVVVTDARSIADIKSMTVHCPRCAKKQIAGLGESRCGGCGLIFLLRVAEPHCVKCNYVLLDIRSGRCPECGEPIVQAAPSSSVIRD